MKISTDDDYFIYMKEVCRLVGKSPDTIYRWVKKGKFPKGKRDGESRVWLESEIDEYLAGTWKPTDDEDSGKKSDE